MPEDAQKSFRTAAYYTSDRRDQDLRYWIMSPAYKKPGYQIKEHNVGTSSSFVSRIADEVPEHDALMKMAELEQAAAAKLRLADDSNDFTLRRLGQDYKNAEPQAPHSQKLLAEMNAAKLKLRPKNPGLKLKP